MFIGSTSRVSTKIFGDFSSKAWRIEAGNMGSMNQLPSIIVAEMGILNGANLGTFSEVGGCCCGFEIVFFPVGNFIIPTPNPF